MMRWRQTPQSLPLPEMQSHDGKWWFRYGKPGQTEATDEHFRAARYELVKDSRDVVYEAIRQRLKDVPMDDDTREFLYSLMSTLDSEYVRQEE